MYYLQVSDDTELLWIFFYFNAFFMRYLSVIYIKDVENVPEIDYLKIFLSFFLYFFFSLFVFFEERNFVIYVWNWFVVFKNVDLASLGGNPICWANEDSNIHRVKKQFSWRAYLKNQGDSWS